MAARQKPHQQGKRRHGGAAAGDDKPKKKWQLDADERQTLEQRIRDEAPEPGTTPLADDLVATSAKSKKRTTASELAGDDAADGAPASTTGAARQFADLAISRYTKQALDEAGYRDMTDIQRAAIPHALAGRDILGAAKTGSGKTLAFLVPLLEALYRARWGAGDGLGALVISPTRELALQIFDELRAIGKLHDFSAGLVIGGKEFAAEQAHIGRMNILVATPGRLLQHLDQTETLDCSKLQVLVLDEADRILDEGFQREVNAIVEHLPGERQTLLFSATQTRSVKDLARLSLGAGAQYLAVHERSAARTPDSLQQFYVACELEDKLDLLWSFVKSHLTTKSIVFVQSCKQVHFLFEALRQLQPGVPLMELHGKMKQMKRLAIFTDFCRRKQALLLCTDIAARGLDFPNVDWVLQLDCPADVATYIHRVGRTARMGSEGKALLFLLSSEQPMADTLVAAKIPLQRMKANPKRTQPITGSVAGLVAASNDLRLLAQKACKSYLRAVYLQQNKLVFDMELVVPHIDPYARSLGLLAAPIIKFGASRNALKNRRLVKRDGSGGGGGDDDDDGAGSSDDDDGTAAAAGATASTAAPAPVVTKMDRLFRRKNLQLEEGLRQAEQLSRVRGATNGLFGAGDDDDDDDNGGGDNGNGGGGGGDEFLVVKRRLPSERGGGGDGDEPEQSITKSQAKKLKLVREGRRMPKGVVVRKVLYDDDGNEITGGGSLVMDAATGKLQTVRIEEAAGAGGELDRSRRLQSIADYKQRLREQTQRHDTEDREIARQKRRARQEKVRAAERAERQKDDDDDDGDGGGLAVIANPVEDDDDGGYDDDDGGGSDDDGDGGRPPAQPSAAGARRGKLTLAEQEELALQMLS